MTSKVHPFPKKPVRRPPTDGAPAREPFDIAGHHGYIIDKVDEFVVVDCSACNFFHVWPLPEPADLEAAYSEDYYAQEKPNFIASAEKDASWAALGYQDRLAILEAVLPPHLSHWGQRKLLDIGCGPGYFLKTAKDGGWHTHGIEPSRQAAAHAKSLGLDITEAFFSEETARSLPLFDAVTLTNVLEHVPNPVDFIRAIDSCLVPGGIVCTTVPNDYSPLQLTARDSLGLRPWWLAPPHHLNYFNFSSLEDLLSAHGFIPRARYTSYPMEWFLLGGENYVDDPSLGRACHESRMKFDKAFSDAGAPERRRALYSSLAETGIGREAIVFAEKPMPRGIA